MNKSEDVMEKKFTTTYDGRYILRNGSNSVYNPEIGNFEEGPAIDKLGKIEDAQAKKLLMILPCKEGDIVYRICPKCNYEHDGSCKNCSWENSLFTHGCDVYKSDGTSKRQIVPYKVTWNYYPNLIEHLGKTVFLTREEAEQHLLNLK